MNTMELLVQFSKDLFEEDNEEFVYALRTDDGIHNFLVEEFSDAAKALAAYEALEAEGPNPEKGVNCVELTCEAADGSYGETFMSEDWGFDWP